MSGEHEPGWSPVLGDPTFRGTRHDEVVALFDARVDELRAEVDRLQKLVRAWRDTVGVIAPQCGLSLPNWLLDGMEPDGVLSDDVEPPAELLNRGIED